MRTLMAVLVALVLWTGIGYAAPQWEFVCTEDTATSHFEYYIDANGVKVVQVDVNEIIKAKFKVVNVTSGGYSLDQYWVNSDTKQWKLAFTEWYKDDKVTSQFDFRHQSWNDYDPSNKVVNEILKRAGQ